jgi:hypothetical protein
MSAPLFANEELSPQQAVANYFEFFNNEDRASLNASSGNPFVFVIGGKPTAYPKYGDAVDFDGMKASGWSYSRIHKNELIYQDDISAMVDINFSRYDDADMPIYFHHRCCLFIGYAKWLVESERWFCGWQSHSR